jgi:hypothetical protein
MKSNLQTWFDPFVKFVDKFGFVFEMSDLKKVKSTSETFSRFENCVIFR